MKGEGWMENYNYEIDPKFLDYFEGKVKQVFFYTTEKCQL